MGLLILLAMIVVPITEIAVFVRAGELIGLWPTIATVLLTAVIGSALLRHQGLSTLARVQQSMNAGRLPMAELFDGLCLLVAGALLLTPGFVTDGVGLLLFLPPFRVVLRNLMAQRLKARGNFQMNGQGGPQGGTGANGHHGFNTTIIDGEFYEVSPENKDNAEKSDDCGPDRQLPPVN